MKVNKIDNSSDTLESEEKEIITYSPEDLDVYLP